MPYRKQGNHLERIPWISSHPFDVKRGTFIGEMSRLATICSLYSHYSDACNSLVGLYVRRGYPRSLVVSWKKDNISKRWSNRIADSPPPLDDVLVLKTEFNTAWNYFDAGKLGKTILEYWHNAIIAIEAGPPYNIAGLRLPHKGYAMGLDGCAYSKALFVPARLGGGDTINNEVLVPDVRTINILNRRLITSRKRTQNLFDLTSLWKRIVFNRLDERVGEDVDPPENRIRDIALVAAPIPQVFAPGERPDSDSDEETIHVHRRSSPVPRTWRFGTLH